MGKIVEFESSSLWSEVTAIASNRLAARLYDYKATLHTEKEDFGVWDLNGIEFYRDYLHDIGEAVRLNFKIGVGDYVTRLYPYRHHLEMTLKMIPLKLVNNETTKLETTVRRYKVIFNAEKNMPVAASELEMHSTSDLNMSDMVEVHLELVDRSLEALRIKTVGGAFKPSRLEDLIRSLVGHGSAQVRVDGKPAIDGIDIVPPDNAGNVSNLVIPHGTRMTGLPTFLQLLKGVYNRGIGTYFQTYRNKKLWFIYPTFDTERFDQNGKKVVFYAVPQERLPQLDRTYLEDGDVLKIAVTAQRRYMDSGEVGVMNAGSGYRMADARSFMKKPVQITESGVKAVRHQLNHEVVIAEREDGLNYAPRSSQSSANPFQQRSDVLARTMAQVDLVWENSDVSLIFPGMPAKYTYLSQGKVIALRGTILFVHAFTSRVEKHGASPYYQTARITIVCETPSIKPDLPTDGASYDTL